jgi:putative FmdB family regulatory protein
MPTYEYRCKTCGEHLEVVQSFTDDPLTDCPACGAAGELRKVFGNIGITFKGSGFYKTDSRSGSSKTATAAKKDEASSTTSSSESSSTSSGSSSSSSDSSSTSSTSAA